MGWSRRSGGSLRVTGAGCSIDGQRADEPKAGMAGVRQAVIRHNAMPWQAYAPMKPLSPQPPMENAKPRAHQATVDTQASITALPEAWLAVSSCWAAVLPGAPHWDRGPSRGATTPRRCQRSAPACRVHVQVVQGTPPHRFSA